MEHEQKHSHDHGSPDHHGHHPLVPLSVYYTTLGALIVLTVVTVGASYIDFGKFNFLVAMAIACAKASLVMMFFMGLKYDNNLNRAFILSSFAALILLIVISASDLWTRPQETPVKVAAAAVLSKEEFAALEKSTPELLARGKEVYDVNCAVCHGAGGNGDGVGGAALNPKPRNFHDPGSSWKNGSSKHGIYVTLAYGISGSGMASYQALPPADRWALVHYVRESFAKGGDATGKGDARFADAMKADGIGEGAGGGGAKASLPIDFAIERMLKN